MKYPYLFQGLPLGRVYAKNRIFLSPMGEDMGKFDGSVSEEQIAYYAEIAKGGCAVITPGVVCVDYPQGKPTMNTTRMDDTRFISGYSRLAERVHRYGALLIPQIHHAGMQTHAGNTEGLPPVGPTNEDPEHLFVKMYRSLGPNKELTTEEVKTLVQKFVQTAVNCKAAGCDGVTLHAAHGYLISQFISADVNKRTDEYGGTFEKRMRFVLEIISGIRAACGPDFIIGARIAGKEFVSDGNTEEQCVEAAVMMEEAGCDYFDISVGPVSTCSRAMETERYKQGNRVQYAVPIKQAVKKAKVGVVGVLRDPDYCNQILEEGKVDFVVLGRTLICDPYWPTKAFEGKDEEIRPCLSCTDACGGRVNTGLPVRCVLNPAAGRELEYNALQKTSAPKHVVVIGGGLAGMQAALGAAHVGHKVTVLEQSDKLGGQLNLASVPPFKGRIAKANQYFQHQLELNQVEVKMNCAATAELVQSMNPDTVILATGAVPVESIPVAGVEHTVQAWDVLKAETLPEAKNVVIIGGGIVGCEVAECFLDTGASITILEKLPSYANGLESTHLLDMMTEFAVKGVQVITQANVQNIASDAVTYSTAEGEATVVADLIILAAGQKSAGRKIGETLKAAGINVKVVGDAKKPAKFFQATQEGFYAGADA